MLTMPHRSGREESEVNGRVADGSPPVVEMGGPGKGPPPPPPARPPPPPLMPGKDGGLAGLKIRPVLPATVPEPREEVRDSLAQLKTRLTREGCNPDQMTFIAHYQQVLPVLQDGPMCGLVALCMAGKLLGNELTADEVLNAAKEENFTKQGEMFSVSHMADLAVGLTKCKYELWHGRQVRSEDILMALSDNRPILIPYDADGNNEPCLKRGHKAHWAVLSGFIWGIQSSEKFQSDLLEQDPSMPNLYHIKHRELDLRRTRKITASVRSASTFLESLKLCGSEDAYVLAKQGKSAHTKLWPLKDLLASNDNLVEAGNKIESDLDNYLLPKEGIKRTLCGKVLVLEKRS